MTISIGDRISKTVKDSLKRNYQTAAKRHRPRTIDQKIALAINIIADLDPMDRLSLSLEAEEERLQQVINYMTR